MCITGVYQVNTHKCNFQHTFILHWNLPSL